MQSTSGSGPGNAVTDDMSVEEIDATTALTRAALKRALLGRLAAVQPAATNTPAFIKYEPSQQSSAFNSGAAGRIIRLSETPLDPLVPPKFKSKRLPRPGRSSPPAPVMSSPSRPPSRREQDDWKVPPCVSRWKNPKGYTIPLDKRQRASEDVRVSGSFAMLVEALYAVEKKAVEAVRMRSAMHKELRAKEMERREQDLRRLARSARAERAAMAAAPAAPAVSAKEDTMQSEANHKTSDVRGADADEQLEKLAKTDKAPARVGGSKRERPTELDKPEQSDDPFDLDQFMAQFASLGMGEFDLDELLRSMLHIK